MRLSPPPGRPEEGTLPLGRVGRGIRGAALRARGTAWLRTASTSRNSAKGAPSLVLALLLHASPVQAHGSGGIDVPNALAGLALAVSAALYLAALHRGAALRPRHVAAFAAGWVALALALLSPVARAAGTSFAIHMVQHELLMVAAPPLLILGRPFTALAANLPPGALRVVAWPLRIPPLAAWGIHAAALWLWHLPRLFDAGLASSTVHALQHASFFLSALLFWWTVFRRVRSGMAVLYMLATLIHTGALAALLTFAPAPLYLDTSLAQQQLGGLLMWVPAGYALLLAGLIAFNRLLEKHA
jgi:putative membrane protein